MTDYIKNIFANEDKTEINIPVDEGGILEIEQYVSLGLRNWDFGDLYLSDDSRADDDYHHIGKVKVKIDLSECDLDIDVRGILIKKVQNKIDKLNADYTMEKNNLNIELEKLRAIEYKPEGLK